MLALRARTERGLARIESPTVRRTGKAPVLFSPLRLNRLLFDSDYFVYFPLGFTNGSGFKSGLLTQAYVSLV